MNRSNMFTYPKLYMMTMMCVVVVLVAVSCKQEPQQEVPKDLHFPFADSLLNVFNADRPAYNLGEKTEGTVEIKIEDDRIVLEHVADGANELYAYFLQTDKKEKNLKPGKLGRCEVVYMERQLIINSLESFNTILLYVDSDGQPAYAANSKRIKSYAGYGLGLRKITIGSPADKAPYCKCLVPDTYPFHCNGGGTEQIHCASSNVDGACRVSCNNKTYPCCDIVGGQ